MLNRLTLLHLSDLQFGHNHRFGRLAVGENGNLNVESLLGRLKPEIDLMNLEGLQPDILVVSGDLAETGSKQEFLDVGEFIGALAERLGLARSKVVIVPGNHDINWAHCKGYFSTCEGDRVNPQEPYWPKWKNFADFFANFYGQDSSLIFTETTPWTFYEIPDLKLAIAGLNSTIKETHEKDTHYGWVGEDQLCWFEKHLETYVAKGWFRVGVVHHNLHRNPVADDENLRDVSDLERHLGSRLNMFLHGHTHEGRIAWMNPKVPIISTGSASLKVGQRPEEIGNQYQVIEVTARSLKRWLRRYDPSSKQWIGDTRLSANGTDWQISDEVGFENVSGCLRIADPEVVEPQTEAIVQINKSVSTEDALRKLSSIPRLRLKVEPHHNAVRQDEQERLVRTLQKQQCVWLVADWAQGKEGFLGCVIARLGAGASESIFRLQCGNVSDCNDLLNAADTQLGLTFQEFLAAVATLPSGVLILDDLPQIIASGREREPLEARLKTIADFCPRLRIILITRQIPRSTAPEEIVTLRSLEAPEVRDYLALHPRRNEDISQADSIERVHHWSGGLPMHLDRLLERLPYLPLSEILSDDSNSHSELHAEPVPESLVRSIQALSMSSVDRSQRSFQLLKVLTVLKDGETFETIRRFFPRRPIYSANVDELISHALIEPVPITLTAPNLGLKRSRDRQEGEAPRLLRVPRQVRDYMNSFLSDKDKEDIIWAAMSFFFGQQWWKNVRLRTSIENAYSQSALAGPGNEHVIVRLVLVRALDRRDYRRAEKYARVFTSYCAKLIERDRFRDAAIATEGMIQHLAVLPTRAIYLEIVYIQSRALHMTGQNRQAIAILESVVEETKRDMTDDFKADLMLILALCYKSTKRETDALKMANEVIAIAHAESHNAFQAHAIIAEQSLSGAALSSRLRELEAAARSKGRKVVADNIALDLARESTDPDQAIELLERVIRPDGDTYNKTRAIIEKAAILTKNRRLSELQDSDHQILSEAYGYCYAQRFGNLLDRCHRVLWGLCLKDGIIEALLRLFRYSSFIWRLRGEETREHEYLAELSEVAKGDASSDNLASFEFTYFHKRKVRHGTS